MCKSEQLAAGASSCMETVTAWRWAIVWGQAVRATAVQTRMPTRERSLPDRIGNYLRRYRRTESANGQVALQRICAKGVKNSIEIGNLTKHRALAVEPRNLCFRYGFSLRRKLALGRYSYPYKGAGETDAHRPPGGPTAALGHKPVRPGPAEPNRKSPCLRLGPFH